MAARALAFAALAAAHIAEVLSGRWCEIDLTAKVWSLPADRIKAGREHRVPLSDAALGVLEMMRPSALMRDNEPDPAAAVFPGARRAPPMSNIPMSNMTMLMLAAAHEARRSDGARLSLDIFGLGAAERCQSARKRGPGSASIGTHTSG
jgi:integrase